MNMNRWRYRNIARLTLQTGVAVTLTYQLMTRAGLPEAFIAVLSAALVIKPSVGNAVSEGRDRILATIIGCVLAIACFTILPAKWGTAVALAVSVMSIQLISGFRKEWRYGIVAAVALSLGTETDPWQSALDRCIGLGIGVLIGLLVSAIVWPDTAGKRARRHIKAALRATWKRLEIAVHNAQSDGNTDAGEWRKTFHQSLGIARDSVNAMVGGDSEQLQSAVAQTERLYNSVLILNRVAEETDSAGGSDAAFQDLVESCRELACGMIEALVDGETQLSDDLDQFKEKLEKLRQQATRNDDSPRDHVMKNAMVFGMGEVGDSLRDLAQVASS